MCLIFYNVIRVRSYFFKKEKSIKLGVQNELGGGGEDVFLNLKVFCLCVC